MKKKQFGMDAKCKNNWRANQIHSAAPYALQEVKTIFKSNFWALVYVIGHHEA